MESCSGLGPLQVIYIFFESSISQDCLPFGILCWQRPFVGGTKKISYHETFHTVDGSEIPKANHLGYKISNPVKKSG